MMIAEIIDVWIGDGTKENQFRPSIIDKYPNIKMDVAINQDTINIPNLSPNSVVIRIESDAETVDTIDNDADYYTLWIE